MTPYRAFGSGTAGHVVLFIVLSHNQAHSREPSKAKANVIKIKSGGYSYPHDVPSEEETLGAPRNLKLLQERSLPFHNRFQNVQRVPITQIAIVTSVTWSVSILKHATQAKNTT